MNPTTTSPPSHIQTRACDDCGQHDLYEPIEIFGHDMGADFPFYCQACAGKREAAEKEDARKAAIEAMRRTWEAIVPERYRATDTAHPQFNGPAWNGIKNHDWQSRGLGLIGSPGRCKTRILALLAKRAIYAGKRIAWTTPFEIEAAAARGRQRTTDADARVSIKHWTLSDILFIDDLGKTTFTASFGSALFEIIEGRYNANRVTHWSLNPIPTDLPVLAGGSIPAEIIANALDPDGVARNRHILAPIVSRLRETTQFVWLQ